MPEPVRLIVLLSGSGSMLENIFKHIEKHDLPARVELVIASRADAYGLERARKRGVETALVASRNYRFKVGPGRGMDWEALSAALNEIILPRRPDLVCLAGFMCKYILPPELEGKVINIHPALLPDFGGQGMYGRHVHEAVLKAEVKESGCTVHVVNNEYDAGAIILQRRCPVQAGDTAETLAARVFAEECRAYPEAIRRFAEGRLKMVAGQVAREQR